VKKARGVLDVAGKIFHGGRKWWSRQRWEKNRRKWGRLRGKKNLETRWCFANFSHWVLPIRGIECTFIYRRWKRDMLVLLVPNISPWLNPEEFQPLVQSCYYGLKKVDC
jgi:hypothetical protein